MHISGVGIVNKLKSLFVMPWLMSTMGIAAFAIYSLIASGYDLGYLGTLLASAPIVGFMAFLMVVGMGRTSANLPVILGLGVVGLILSAYDFMGELGGSATPLVLSAVALGGLIAYDFWYSHLGRVPSPALKFGEPLPAFSLEDTEGGTVTSQSFVGNPALILFFRGNWCPLCMTQVKEIAADYQKLAGFGVQIILVSPQSHAQTQELAARFDVPFRFLVDTANSTAKALGIGIENGVPLGISGYDPDTVMPTVVITDASGKIVFLDQTDNYRVRPEPETFLRVLKETGAVAQAA